MPEHPIKPFLTPAEAAQFIAEEQAQPERRGDFVARPVQIQKLNEFGSPNLSVLTRESDVGLTIAGLLPVQKDDELVVYDDHAPGGAQFFYGVVESVRDAHRPTDAVKGMRLIYLAKQPVESAAANTADAAS